LCQFLEVRKIKHRTENEQVVIYTTDISDVLEITSVFKHTIQDLEINKGTLNDVFIAITGKEIRE
jgi:ABC-2 type transport system ATP-binding protein